MSRIESKFSELRTSGRKAFIPFVTAGDPDRKTSTQIIRTLADCGADIIELGVPFSDPMADGPTIQASSMRALENGTSLDDVLEIVRGFRASSSVPIVLFSYLNPIFQYGFERMARDARNAGVDGLLLTDVVDQEAAAIAKVMAGHDIDLVSLIAPTTTDGRLEKIAANARGFLYAVSRAGVTGAREESSKAAETLVRRARNYTELPIAVGFGISTREQIEEVWKYADGAVVGSAIVREIENSDRNAVEAVREFVGQLLPQVAKETAEI